MQRVIEASLIKWKRSLYGPPLGKAALLVVEDINCAACDDSGCNMASELLRQWIDMGGWYDLDDLNFSKVLSFFILYFKEVGDSLHERLLNHHQEHYF